jgi:hypothetical protein
MRNKNLTIWGMVLLVTSFCLPKADATIYFDDGRTHDITWSIADYVDVLDSPSGEPTTVNLLSGALLNYDLEVFDYSRVNMSNGSIDHDLRAYDYSQVDITHGRIGRDLFSLGNSQVSLLDGNILGQVGSHYNSKLTISGGRIWTFLFAHGDSELIFSGGTVGDNLQANSDSHAFISGGTIEDNLEVEMNSRVNLSGGTIGGNITVRHTAVLTIEGYGFQIDGENVGYGAYGYDDYSSGRLTGLLTSNDLLNNDFTILDSASIVLVPEPTTLLLLALGGLLLRTKL